MKTNRRQLISVVAAMMIVGAGCGEADESEPFPATSGNLDVESIDWVVDGMSCGGDEVIRMVGLVEDDGEVNAEYLRGDECVDQGDIFWDTRPTADGDHVEVLVDSGADEHIGFRAERGGDHTIDLVDGDDGEQLTMRQVYPELNPSPRPELEDLDLAGQWWMEDYPCAHEQVPQLVRIIHPPGSLHMNKILGDQCIGDGESFVDDAELGGVSGTSISGTPRLSESSGFPNSGDGEQDDDEIVLELGGTVHTTNYIRLVISPEGSDHGDAVMLRRVMDQ